MMKKNPKDGLPRPLPREWLPEPSPPDGDPEWEARVGRIMTAADRELRALRARRSATPENWWFLLGRWWKLSGSWAAAATALFLLTGPHAMPPEPPPDALALSLIAAEGDPAALWEALGVEADPVLAWLAVHAQREGAEQGTPSAVPEERPR